MILKQLWIIIFIFLIGKVFYSQEINPEFKPLFNKGNELLSTNPDSAIIVFMQIIDHSKKKNDKKTEAQAYGKVGLAFYYLGDVDSCIFFWNISVEKALTIKDYYQAGNMYNNMSIQYLYMQDYDKSYSCIQKAYDTYNIIPDSSGIFECYNNFGTYYLQKDNFDEALKNYKTGLLIAEKMKDTLSIANSHLNIAVVYNSMGNTEYTLKENIFAAHYLEDIKNYHNLALCYGNIGALYIDLNQIDNAKKYLLDASNIIDTIFFEDYYYLSTLINLGIVFNLIKDHDGAEAYFLKALDISKKTQDTKGKINVYLNLSQVYLDKNQLEKALSIAMKALNLSEGINSQKYIASSNKRIGITYNGMNKPRKAIKYLEKAYDISIRSNNLTYILDILNEIKIAYKSLGKYKQAFLTDEKIIFYNDSLSGVETKKQIASLNTIFNIERKEQKIKEQNLNIEKQKAENKAKDLKIRQGNIINITVAIVLILVLGLAFILFKMFNQKKKTNLILTAQKIEIENKNKELNQQNEEILSQRDKIQEQKEHIEEIHREVTDSINYAKRLQTATLPDLSLVKKSISDIFVLFKPKDVVSGDFYWYAEVENQIVITVVDCTGHGVPGAFMSMLGMSMLKEIVVKEYITQPDVILRKLRKEVIKALGQTGASGEQKDGMDMSICSINKETFELQWAGANNPLLLVQKGESAVTELVEIKPNKMPIAIYEKMDRFTLHEIPLKKGDTIYLIGDGYADQFGGPKGKKFMSKKLKELLLEISSKPTKEQHEILETTLFDWMNNYGEKYEQVDDITIMGIKI